MLNLTEDVLNQLPEGVRGPAYDRRWMKIGMAHLGMGAFHRCHQAEYTEDALEAGAAGWGVVGINLHPPVLSSTLGQQNGLYTRTLRDGRVSETRVIGCVKRVIDAGGNPAPAIAALAALEISVATMTITEKGYCHVPATGHLDEFHPDVVHDLRHVSAPRSAIGLLAAALDRRRSTHGLGLTLVSCDNIPSNGKLLRQALSSFCAARDADLGKWVDDHVAFPSTMVDRIVPATSPEDAAWLQNTVGIADRAPVFGEAFRQWVLEDQFAGPRPPWEISGAEFVHDVRPHELIKMRLLNAAQSTLAYLGAFAGHRYTVEAVLDPTLREFVSRMLRDESAATVPGVRGMEADSYIDRALQRIANTAIRHTNHQVATDGSQKIVQRLLNPIRDCAAAGRTWDHLAIALSAWLAYLLAATPRGGSRWVAIDPWTTGIANIAAKNTELGAVVGEVLGIESIFGTDLPLDHLRSVLVPTIGDLLQRDPRTVIREALEVFGKGQEG